MKTFSQMVKDAEFDPVVLEAADREAKFMAWLLEKPETRLPAWAAYSQECLWNLIN